MLIFRCRYKECIEILDQRYFTLENKVRVKRYQPVFFYLVKSENLIKKYVDRKEIICVKPIFVDSNLKFTPLSGCVIARANITNVIETKDTEKPYLYVLGDIVYSKAAVPMCFSVKKKGKLFNIDEKYIRQEKTQ